MRTPWWAYLFVVVLACAAAYPLFDQPSLPAGPAGPPEQPDRYPQIERHPLAQKPELAVSYKDKTPPHEEQVENIHAAPAFSKPPAVSEAPPVSEPQQPAPAQKETRLETPAAITVEHAKPADPRQELPYLAYYAYAEVPPTTKPADTVLAFLKDAPPGTPIEEIKRVCDALGLDFTFMKAVAKIESGFDPKQRTGSYVGLFQLSKREFAMYGDGDILDARDNAVAASLKFMTESILFELFTHKKPTLSDVYLIHQQGVDGAAEHVSHPHRLAWRSMCATDEGREKGEKWCKRAIWGNTLPAFKRVWKNVNNVTSAAFVAMWRQRVSQFYARYSEAAAN